MNLPNKLTILRIILVLIMIIIPYLGLQGEVLSIPITMILLDAIFVIASITDKLDGTLARKNNQTTVFGQFLDPIADKILILVSMMILVECDKLPAWIPSIILFREFIVSGYRLIAVKEEGKVVAASKWGKLKTVTQMIAIIMAFLDNYSFGAFISSSAEMSSLALAFNIISSAMMLICVIATAFSGYEYVKDSRDLLFKDC